MKLLPCARRISATSTAGPATVSAFFFWTVSPFRGRRWASSRWDSQQLANDGGTDADKRSLLPVLRAPAATEWSGDPRRFPAGVWQSYGVACGAIRVS